MIISSWWDVTLPDQSRNRFPSYAWHDPLSPMAKRQCVPSGVIKREKMGNPRVWWGGSIGKLAIINTGWWFQLL